MHWKQRLFDLPGGFEGTCGGYAGKSVGCEGHSGQPAGASRGGRLVGGRAECHWSDGHAGLRGSGLHGAQPVADAAAHGIRLEVVKHTEAKRGFVLVAMEPGNLLFRAPWNGSYCS